MRGLLLSLIICAAAAGVGWLFTSASVDTWYAGLRKPSINPPDWVFGPVWIALYIAMALAAWLVWRQHHRAAVGGAILLYAIQLVLNVGWTAAFFGMRSTLAGLVVIGALWIAILATIIAFSHISASAFLLMIPYLLWVSFAALLNYRIWQLN